MKTKKLSSEEFIKVVKKKYRKIALTCHSDRQRGKSEAEKKKAEELFKEATEAKEALLSEAKSKTNSSDNTHSDKANKTNSSSKAEDNKRKTSSENDDSKKESKSSSKSKESERNHQYEKSEACNCKIIRNLNELTDFKLTTDEERSRIVSIIIMLFDTYMVKKNVMLI